MLRKSAAWMAFLVLLVLVSCPRGGLAAGEWITLSGENPAASLQVLQTTDEARELHMWSS